MKFLIDDSNEIGQQQLIYIEEECSFYTEVVSGRIDIEVVINKISLFVVDNKIIDLSGFCGFNEWIKSKHQVPEYNKGILKVEHNLEYGFAYGIKDEDFPIYVNPQTGWVCIGNPEKLGNAVEFINNCVAVIDDDKEFISLWLKPQSLPQI